MPDWVTRVCMALGSSEEEEGSGKGKKWWGELHARRSCMRGFCSFLERTSLRACFRREDASRSALASSSWDEVGALSESSSSSTCLKNSRSETSA